jgi:hypothetical protein
MGAAHLIARMRAAPFSAERYLFGACRRSAPPHVEGAAVARMERSGTQGFVLLPDFASLHPG